MYLCKCLLNINSICFNYVLQQHIPNNYQPLGKKVPIKSFPAAVQLPSRVVGQKGQHSCGVQRAMLYDYGSEDLDTRADGIEGNVLAWM